jgi:hypothetical protein
MVYEEVTMIGSETSAILAPRAWQALQKDFILHYLPVVGDPSPSAFIVVQCVRRGSSAALSLLAPLSPKRFSMV